MSPSGEEFSLVTIIHMCEKVLAVCLSKAHSYILPGFFCNLFPSECHETSVFLVVSNSKPEQRLCKTQHHTFCSFKKYILMMSMQQ